MFSQSGVWEVQVMVLAGAGAGEGLLLTDGTACLHRHESGPTTSSPFMRAQSPSVRLHPQASFPLERPLLFLISHWRLSFNM